MRKTIGIIVLGVVAVLIAMLIYQGQADKPNVNAEQQSEQAASQHAKREGVATDSSVGAALENSAIGLDSPAPVEAEDSVGRIDPSVLPILSDKLVRSANLHAETTKKSFDTVWSDIQSATKQNKATISSSARSSRESSSEQLRLAISVPSNRFDALLGDLREIRNFDIQIDETDTIDVGEQHIDTTSRLKHERAVERRYLSLLSDAKGINEILTVQSRLDSVLQQIEMLEGRLAQLDKQVAVSTIQITLRAPEKFEARDSDSTLGKALHEAGESFMNSIASGIVFVGRLLPYVLLLFAGFVIWKLDGKKRSAKPQAFAEQEPEAQHPSDPESAEQDS